MNCCRKISPTLIASYVNTLYACLVQCATSVPNSYQTFGLTTFKSYQTEPNVIGPNKKNEF